MNQKNIHQQALVDIITTELKHALNQAISAANEAHAAAVDDQSIAETQYDTLAIEASYLAEGQSRRVEELHVAINSYHELNLLDFNENSAITLTALVQLSKDNQDQHWFFIGPAAGGFRCSLSDQHITVITPQSLIVVALLYKFQEDYIDIKLGSNLLIDYIQRVQ